MDIRVGDLVRPTVHFKSSGDRDIGIVIEVKKEIVSGVSLATVGWTSGYDSNHYRVEPIVAKDGQILYPEIEIIKESR